MKRVFHFNSNLLHRSVGGTSAPLQGVRASNVMGRSSYSSAHQSVVVCNFHSTPLNKASKGSVPLAENLITPPEAAAQAILAAKYNVWGEIQGTNERSGRKWLRQKLRGPHVRGWYGINFRDVFPEYITPIKEEMFEEEQSMHRFGKGGTSGKGGKVKPPKKYMVDTMTFESNVEEILEEVEWSNYTELLTEEEMSQRKALLSSCTSAEDAAIVEDLFIRIATEREANRDKWEAKLIEDEAKGVDDTSGDKKRRTTSFKFREGLADKRLWGQEPTTSSGSSKSSADSEVEVETTTDANDIRFNVDIRGMKQPEIDEAYSKYITDKAKAEWNSLMELKDSVEYSIFYRDLERTLTAMGLPVSEEGLTQLYLLDEETKSAVLSEAMIAPPTKKKSVPVEASATPESSADSPANATEPQGDEKKE